MSVAQAKASLRKKHARSVRLQRLVRLRQAGCRKWVIKSEQVALFLNSRGMKHYGIGSKPSGCQAKLYRKFVTPYMEVES